MAEGPGAKGRVSECAAGRQTGPDLRSDHYFHPPDALFRRNPPAQSAQSRRELARFPFEFAPLRVLSRELAQGLHAVEVPAPRDRIEDALAFVLKRWILRKQAAVEALDLLNGALAKLDNREGDRAAACREDLAAQRDAISAALGALASVVGSSGPDRLNGLGRVPCSGEVFEALVEKLETASAVRDQAQAALRQATRANVRDLRCELDLAEADLRRVGGQIEKLRSELKFPALPNGQDFVDARASTQALLHRARNTRKPMTALELALRQGAETPAAQAKLWVIYETPGCELYAQRWARYLER